MFIRINYDFQVDYLVLSVFVKVVNIEVERYSFSSLQSNEISIISLKIRMKTCIQNLIY